MESRVRSWQSNQIPDRRSYLCSVRHSAIAYISLTGANYAPGSSVHGHPSKLPPSTRPYAAESCRRQDPEYMLRARDPENPSCKLCNPDSRNRTPTPAGRRVFAAVLCRFALLLLVRTGSDTDAGFSSVPTPLRTWRRAFSHCRVRPPTCHLHRNVLGVRCFLLKMSGSPPEEKI